MRITAYIMRKYVRKNYLFKISAGLREGVSRLLTSATFVCAITSSAFNWIYRVDGYALFYVYRTTLSLVPRRLMH
jgi:hypothetical protein